MRMKTAYRLVIAILPAFLAAGCDKDMNAGGPSDGRVPVEITGAAISAGVPAGGKCHHHRQYGRISHCRQRIHAAV